MKYSSFLIAIESFVKYDKNHKQSSKLSLDDFTRIEIPQKIDPEDSKDGLKSRILYQWKDKNNLVASVYIADWSNNWISCDGLEISPKYRGHGLSHQLVEFIKIIGVNHLSVHPNNKVAIELYKKHEFILTGTKEGKLLRMELSN